MSISRHDEGSPILAALCHASTFFLPIILPIVVWLLIAKRTSLGLIEQAKEALNFQISFTVYGLVVVFALKYMIQYKIPVPPAVIQSWHLVFALVVLILAVLGIIRALTGIVYRYPLIFRIIP